MIDAPARRDALRVAHPISTAQVIGIAIPITLANLSAPLVGIVDTAVVGRLGRPDLIAGVAVGAVLFDMVLAAFGFLRLATAGLTAQAVGARDADGTIVVLTRALLLALLFGAVTVLCKQPIVALSLPLMSMEGGTAAAAETYFAIRLWSVPLVFVDFVLTGWLIGIGRTGAVMALAFLYAAVNIVASVALVLRLGLGVSGVAWASVLAEACFCLAAVAVAARAVGDRFAAGLRRALRPDGYRRLFAINRDITIRSLVLLAAFAWFTRAGGRHGETTIAANAILMHLFMLTAFLLDGFATAAEQLAGRAVGARDRLMFDASVRVVAKVAVASALVLTLVGFLTGDRFVALMTTTPEVARLAVTFLPYAVMTPLLGVVAFQMDGVYIGATWSRDMRDMMLLSFAVFLAADLALSALFGNHGLWAAFLLFLSGRAVFFSLRLRKRADRTFASA